MQGFIQWGMACLLLTVSSLGLAEDNASYNRVSFQVQVQESVANDRMVVTLAAEADEAEPADVAERINNTMQWALAQANGVEGVKVKTGNYSINPVYRKDVPRRWRGYQELHLEGEDFTRLSELMGVLQERLQVKSTRFEISDERRKAIEQALIDQAAERFQQRAAQLVKSFAAKRYVLVSANVNTSGYQPRANMRMNVAMMAEASAPAMEGGESDVVVSMNGEIELIP